MAMVLRTAWRSHVILTICSLMQRATCCYSYTHNYQVRRTIPDKSPAQAYKKCLQGWREENFNLPLNPPFILHQGDQITGKGFELMRIPPFGLREAIIDHEHGPQLVMIYKVMNPGWFTYPVVEHQGKVTFIPKNEGTELDWNIQWTPLPHCGWVTQFFTELVVNKCVEFVVDKSDG